MRCSPPGQHAHPEEAVDHGRFPAHHGGHPGGCQRCAVLLPLVAQRVEAGGPDPGRRQAPQVRVEQRGHGRIGPQRRVGAVLLPEPQHVRPGEEQSLGELEVRGRGHAQVGGRIDQPRRDRRRAPGVAEPGRHHRRQRAARAVPHDRHGVTGPQLLGMAHDPSGGRQRIIDCCGEGVLGRAPIVHRDDDRPGDPGQHPAVPVVGVEIPDDPSPAVEVHDQRRLPAGRRRRGRHARRWDRPARAASGRRRRPPAPAACPWRSPAGSCGAAAARSRRGRGRWSAAAAVPQSAA